MKHALNTPEDVCKFLRRAFRQGALEIHKHQIVQNGRAFHEVVSDVLKKKVSGERTQ